MLGQTALWDAALRCHAAQDEAAIPHAVIGGVAVCLHGYQRTTVDLDLLIRPEDGTSALCIFAQAEFVWNAQFAEFRVTNGISVDLHYSGVAIGLDGHLQLPDPTSPHVVQMIEGLPVLRLERLIEIKTAIGINNRRRAHREFADVVELAAVNMLRHSFARQLHASLRKSFRILVNVAQGDSP